MTEEMDEIWQLFADDGGQSLDTIEEILLSQKANPSGQADIGALFRAMHTFKGNCRVLGLAHIESRAHLAEDLIGLVRDDGVALCAEMVELLLEMADALRAMLEETLVSRRDADEAASSALAERMRATFERCKAGDEAEWQPKAIPVAELEPEPEPELEPEPEAKSAAAPTPAARGGGGRRRARGQDGWRGGETAPIWMKMSSVLSSSQCSTKRPFSTRQMSIERMAKALPVPA